MGIKILPSHKSKKPFLLGSFGLFITEYGEDREYLVSMINKYSIKSGKKWLNAGCGARFYPYPNVINCDLFPRHRCVMKVDLEKRLPFNNKEFSVAFTSHVFEHLIDPDRAFKELSRVADYVVCLVPYYTSYISNLSPEHRWKYRHHLITTESCLYPRKKIR